MRIIFLEAVQNFGGSKRSIIDISEQLKILGHDVLLVDFWGSNEEFNNAVKSRGLKMEVLEPRVSPFILSHQSRVIKIKNNLMYFFARLKYKRMFRKISNRYKPDYVCINTSKALDILSKNQGYEIDYYVRGWRLINSLRDRVLIRKYNPRFIAISEATRQAISIQRNLSLDNIRVLKVALREENFAQPNRIEVSRFNKEKPIKLLHAGTFVRNKGQHIAIEIARSLKDQGFNFKLKLAGLISAGSVSNRYYEELKKMVSDYNLEGNVEFVVNNHDLSQEFDASDVFVYPSQSEGLSRVCLEAMAKGKPVVANPAGGITDFLIDGFNGFLVLNNNIDDYVLAISKYYSSPRLCVVHGDNGVAVVNSGYLNRSYREALLKIYNS